MGNVVSVRLHAEPRADNAQGNIEVVNIVGVDPRDQTWEVDAPRYRVYFHERSGASDEYEISGANVAEVLTWLRRSAVVGPSSCTSARPPMAWDCCAWQAPIRTPRASKGSFAQPIANRAGAGRLSAR